MKPYGIPRNFEAAYPDSVDGVLYAVKSSKVRRKGRGGDYKSAMHSSRRKHLNRIGWKRRARTEAKAALRAFFSMAKKTIHFSNKGLATPCRKSDHTLTASMNR